MLCDLCSEGRPHLRLVVLGSDLDNIYREASEILDWAFASFSDRELVDTETPLTTAPLKKCRSYEEVELYAAAPVSGYGHADDKVTFTYDLRKTSLPPSRMGLSLARPPFIWTAMRWAR